MREKIKFKKWTVIGGGIAVLGAFAVILYFMRVWEMDLNIPISVHGGDGELILSIFKSIYENGLNGLYFNPMIGAPDGSNFVECPFIDTLLALEVVFLSKFCASANAVFYVVYFLTYPLAAATMYLLAGKFTSNTFIRTLISFSYAITPYHMYRGMGHLTLSHYYIVPIAIYLMILIYEKDFIGPVPKQYCEKGQRWKIVLMYIGAIIIGLSNVYYAFFGLLCMATAWLAKMIKKKNIKLFINEAVPMYVVLLSVLTGLLPKIIYTLQNGSNPMVAQRAPMECEIYALKIIQMLIPPSYSRVGFLRKLNDLYSGSAYNINENAFASLGLIATIGFIAACVWAIIRLVDKNHEIKTENTGKMSITALTILVVVLYSVGGGFGTFVNYFISPEIRGFNRSSVVIACLSLCFVVLMFNYLYEKISRNTIKVVVYSVASLIMIFTLYSETTAKVSGWQDGLKASDASLSIFFEEIEASLEDGAMIYQLPYVNFPEVGKVNGMNDYELMTPYLYTNSIRWSYGGVKGRNTTAESLNVDDGMSMLFVNNIIEAGFEGVYIDTAGYADGGVAVIDYYQNILGIEPILTKDGWLYFFDLSQVTIDPNQLVSGYKFFDTYLSDLGADYSPKEIKELATNIFSIECSGYDTLYTLLERSGRTDSEISNESYVRWLYNKVLLREPADKEVEYWSKKIADGVNRKEIMLEFFACEEFRNKYVSEE